MKLYPHPDFYTEDDLEEFDVIDTSELQSNSNICILKVGTTIRFNDYEDEYFTGVLIGYNKDIQAGRILYVQTDDKYFTIDIICAGDLIEVV